LKKLCAVLLFVFVAMLAAGAAFAYDTKIIDGATNLKHLPTNVRPIGHYGTPSVETIVGPRRVGPGYTTPDLISDDIFFSKSQVGVRDTTNGDYITEKQSVLAANGGYLLNIQEAEATALWRAIPEMTGSLLQLCYDDPCCDEGVVSQDVMRQKWLVSGDKLINSWALAERTKYDDFWGNKTRTPHAIVSASYGFAVPRLEARNIANAYFEAGNPGTNTEDQKGQELLTSVFVWSADMKLDWVLASDDAAGDSKVDTVAVMVRLDNDLYKGLKVSDITVLKVEEEKEGEHWPFTQVYTETELKGKKFAVVKRTWNYDCGGCPGRTVPTDVVLGPDEIIQAGNRTGALDPDNPCDNCGKTCDREWETMQYFVLIGVQKGDVRDTAGSSPDEKGVVSSVNLIIGHRPFTKTPDIRCGFVGGVYPRFGWVLGNRPNAEQRYDGFTRDPFLADAIDGTDANFGLASGYPKAVMDAMKNWHQMYFVTDEVVNNYGFEGSIVYRLPAVRTQVPSGQTAAVMYTIRIGTGEKEINPDDIVGSTPADITAFDVRGTLLEDKGEFTRVSDCRALENGTFIILKKDADNPLQQDVMPDDEKFVADGVYYVALAVQDGGDYDQDKYGVVNGQSWVSPVFLVFGGKKADPELQVTPANPTINVGGTQQFSAIVTDGSEPPTVAWSSSDDTVATVDPVTGLATALAAGVTTITATPEVVSDDVVASNLVAASTTLTVEQPAPPSGGSSGGCSVGGFGPASLFLLAPLFLLLKK